MSSLNPRHHRERGGRALERFLGEVLGSIGRMERRRWAGEYVRGLLSDAKRKTVAAMAEHLPHGNSQALNHVLTNSPWDCDEVMRRLTETVMVDLEPEPAWVLRSVGFSKRGLDSVGVARQPAGAGSRPENVQVGLSLHHIGCRGSLILGWRLFLPHEWAADLKRRHKAEIPDDTLFRTRPELALDLLDQALQWRIPRAIVVAKVSFEDFPHFAAGLRERNLGYMLEVPAAFARDLVPQRSWTPMLWRGGNPKKWQESLFSTARIAAPSELACGSSPVWLLAERRHDAEVAERFFISNLADDSPVRRLARLARAGPRADAQVRELHMHLGLDHFEGRNWRGWHHHVTLVAVAHAFRMSEDLRNQPDWFLEALEPE